MGESYLRAVVSQGIMSDFRTLLFDRLLGQIGRVLHGPPNWRRLVPGHQRRVWHRRRRWRDGLRLAESAIVGVSTLVFMAVLDWRLTAFVVVVLPIFLLPARRVGTRIFRARKAIQEKLAEIGVHTQEVLGISGLLLVKAFGTRARERRRLRALSGELRDLEIRQNLIGRWFSMVMDVLATAGPGLFWLFGGYLVIHGGASVGTVVTFVAVLTPRLAGAVANLGNLQVNVTGSSWSIVAASWSAVVTVTCSPPTASTRGCTSASSRLRPKLWPRAEPGIGAAATALRLSRSEPTLVDEQANDGIRR